MEQNKVEQHYKDLSGGEGREVYFRAERHDHGDLVSSDLLTATLDGQTVRLNDISLTGLSLISDDLDMDWLGMIGHPALIGLDVAREPVFEGSAQVIRAIQVDDGVLIGLRFVDRLPNIKGISARLDEAFLASQINLTDQVEPDLVPDAYKAVCADVLNLLSWQRDMLNAFEDRIGDRDPDGRYRQAALHAIEEKVLARWRVLWQRAEDIVRPMDMESVTFKAAKRYTEQVITPALSAGPVWDRSYRKPLGYPGDYAIMKMVYAWSREGKSLADKVVHRIGLDVAECIATRMILVQKAIAETIGRFGEHEPARIASLGCGPAKEIDNMLGASRLPGKVHFTLIDQDHEALTDTYERLMPMVVAHHGDAALSMLEETFTKIIRGGVAATELEDQHMIYTVGLVDYLSDTMARSLVARLYKQLAPGGLLMIGNMADSELSNFWPMEFITDWRVLYRSREQMLDMATRCPDAEIEVRPESTGRVWMLYLRKPA